MDDLNATGNTTAGPSEMKKSAMLWGAVALGLSILLVAVNTAPAVVNAGFFAKTFGIVLGVALGTLGALIGDALRKFAAPDFMLTNGGMSSLLWMRIFWTVGPQVIGVFIGSVLGISLVLN